VAPAGGAAAPAAGAAAGAGVAAGVAEAAAVVFAAFCTPPWPLQAPLPVAADVVPSLQVVGAAAVESAWLAIDIANIKMGAARAPRSMVFFTICTPC
jgi:hypothetical protein